MPQGEAESSVHSFVSRHASPSLSRTNPRRQTQRLVWSSWFVTHSSFAGQGDAALHWETTWLPSFPVTFPAFFPKVKMKAAKMYDVIFPLFFTTKQHDNGSNEGERNKDEIQLFEGNKTHFRERKLVSGETNDDHFVTAAAAFSLICCVYFSCFLPRVIRFGLRFFFFMSQCYCFHLLCSTCLIFITYTHVHEAAWREELKKVRTACTENLHFFLSC